MNEAALFVALASLVICLITLAAMVEMYTSLSNVQDAVGIGSSGKNEVLLLEELTKTVISRPPGDIGLDVPQGKVAWYVLFLSTHCGTCNTLARSLGENMPLSVSVVVLGESRDNAERWVESFGIDPSHLQTPSFDLFDPVGVIITPSILVVVGDEMAYIAALESTQAFDRVVHEKYIPPQALALRAGVRSP